MNAIYFAVGCILVSLVVYWGSAKTEPARLTRLLGQRPPGAVVPPPKKRGR